MDSEINLSNLIMEIIPAIGVTTLLIIALWLYFKGYIPSRGERELLVSSVERERKRADKKDVEAGAAHERLDQLTETLPRIVELLESVDRRLDMHGFPADNQKRSRRWPWSER